MQSEVIFFDEKGNFMADKTDEVLSARLKVERAVIPGFYGATEDGKVVTFSRGGSDITGSIVAKAVDADLYEKLDRCIGCACSRSAYYRQSENDQGHYLRNELESFPTWERPYCMKTRSSR